MSGGFGQANGGFGQSSSGEYNTGAYGNSMSNGFQRQLN